MSESKIGRKRVTVIKNDNERKRRASEREKRVSDVDRERERDIVILKVIMRE